jgi:hypothetical protein
MHVLWVWCVFCWCVGFSVVLFVAVLFQITVLFGSEIFLVFLFLPILSSQCVLRLTCVTKYIPK